MKLIKPSPGLIAEFKAVQHELVQAQPRKMFGYDALFVNGNMAIGLWQNTCVAKLSTNEQQELLSTGQGKPFMPMPGRPMSGWVELSEDLSNDPEELLRWARRAVEFVASLPPKAMASRKRPAKAAHATKTPGKKKTPAEKKAPAKKAPPKKLEQVRQKPSKSKRGAL